MFMYVIAVQFQIHTILLHPRVWGPIIVAVIVIRAKAYGVHQVDSLFEFASVFSLSSAVLIFHVL